MATSGKKNEEQHSLPERKRQDFGKCGIENRLPAVLQHGQHVFDPDLSQAGQQQHENQVAPKRDRKNRQTKLEQGGSAHSDRIRDNQNGHQQQDEQRGPIEKDKRGDLAEVSQVLRTFVSKVSDKNETCSRPDPLAPIAAEQLEQIALRVGPVDGHVQHQQDEAGRRRGKHGEPGVLLGFGAHQKQRRAADLEQNEADDQFGNSRFLSVHLWASFCRLSFYPFAFSLSCFNGFSDRPMRMTETRMCG